MRTQTRGRIALGGPSGSGHTFTALAIAAGLGSSTAVIEAVHGHASQYADLFDFDVCPPLSYCSPESLVAALATCAALGYGTVVIDSFSLFWAGPGGILEQVDDAAKRGSGGGNNAGWKEVRPRERRMLDALFAYPGDVVVTLRSTMEYVLEPDEQGRKHPRRVGGKPVAREGIEYEFNFVASLDTDHTLVVNKALSPGLAGTVVHRPGREFGAQIRAWLDEGAPQSPTEPVASLIARARRPEATFDELGALMRTVRARFLEDVQIADDDGETPIDLGVYITRRGSALQATQAQDNAAYRS
ncbi:MULTISPECIES: AAA family ATPase [unclassified Streptomyces]|uniref:AAA family ATPase n=1 Tax=unclassified Streptomyces TaxID=2593676 RepID=UPI0022527243|nr:AAA family ATPase [Streptomyces sp. NBC_01264]MCX4784047.1 ATP-binding protein [Streptomyces sp. NBC_01264]